MHIWLERIDRFTKIYDGMKYLVLFGPQQYDTIYNRIKYLISEKSGIAHSINHNFAKIRILYLEKKTD